jgi:putative ABC transport system substrate-binding protein
MAKKNKQAHKFVIFTILALSLAAGLFFWWYQPANKEEPVKKVGVLLSGDIRLDKLVGLKEGLEEQGFLEGINIGYNVKNAEDSAKLLSNLAAELISEKPDVLVALGGVEADALKERLAQQEEKVPLVFAGVASTVRRGLVESFQYPEANITGVDNYHAQLAGKRLELLTKLLPDTRQVLVIYDPDVPPGKHSLAVAAEAAAILNIQLVKYPVGADNYSLDHLERTLSATEIEAILLLSSFFLEAAADELFQLALDYQIPVMGVNTHEPYHGSFASYGVPFYQQGRQAAPLVTKILHGQHPRQIPIESPDKIELIVNMAIAERLGLRVSPVGLSYATVVYQDDF